MLKLHMGTSQRSTYFKLEEAKLLPVLGMPASSLAPEQLLRGSDLSRGIIRNSKLLAPAGISVAWTHRARADEQATARARVTAQLLHDSKRCSSGMSPRTTSMGPDDVINDVSY